MRSAEAKPSSQDSPNLYYTLIDLSLPAGLADTGDLALVSQFTEADTANAVVTQVGVGTAADLAPVVCTGGELGLSLLLQNHRLSCHF